MSKTKHTPDLASALGAIYDEMVQSGAEDHSLENLNDSIEGVRDLLKERDELRSAYDASLKNFQLLAKERDELKAEIERQKTIISNMVRVSMTEDQRDKALMEEIVLLQSANDGLRTQINLNAFQLHTKPGTEKERERLATRLNASTKAYAALQSLNAELLEALKYVESHIQFYKNWTASDLQRISESIFEAITKAEGGK
jgi:chromosome segregation ATPase